MGEPVLLGQLRQLEDDYQHGEKVAAALTYGSLLDLLPETPVRAMEGIDGRRAITHKELKEFVANEFNLRRFGIAKGDRVGSLIPNGPESGSCFLGCAAWCTYAPLNPASSAEEIHGEMQNVRAKAIIVQAGESNEAAIKVAQQLNMLVLEITPDPVVCATFSMKCKVGVPGAPSSDPPNAPSDVALVLHTSGTTGNKKVVPYRLAALVTGAGCMVLSYKFRPTDCNLNMMPLFHVGGLARNILAPIVSGGAVVCFPAFDAVRFWELVGKMKCTWYYGAPTMHQLILEQASKLTSIPNHSIRIICNAAGPLPHTVAVQLTDMFRATVLPSYGMTECMPISAPPLSYRLERPGTSGKALGPQLAIMGDTGNLLSSNETGEIVVKGTPVFEGYEGNDKATGESFANGWFKTGDVGHIDADGWLFVTGRSKEVINRGGEIISPTEIENEILKHEYVRNCIAFSAPHDTLQEVVGVVIVPKANTPMVGLTAIHRFVASTLFPAKWPQVIVFMDDVPKGSTGKPIRVKLSNRLGMDELSDSMSKSSRIFQATCPVQGAPVSQPIPMTKYQVDRGVLENMILKANAGVREVVMVDGLRVDGQESKGPQRVAFVSPPSADIAAVLNDLHSKTQGTLLEDFIPQIVVPVAVIPKGADGVPDKAQLRKTVKNARRSWRMSVGLKQYRAPEGPVQEKIVELFREVLELDEVEMISVDADFFTIGGSSIKAGQLAGMLRKAFKIPITATTLFRHRSPAELADAIESNPAYVPPEPHRRHGSIVSTLSHSIARFSSRISRRISRVPTTQYASADILVYLIQLIPIAGFHPVQRVLVWMLFILAWTEIMRWDINFISTRFPALIAAMLFIKIVKVIVIPLVGISLKWIVIGRYKAGTYPIWGSYYLRWWLVHQALDFCGKGMFEMFPVQYYRLLGATIGANVKISSNASITEADLVEIGDHCVLDGLSSITPFGLLNGLRMQLAPVKLGHSVAVCHRAIVCPGSEVPAGKSLPPLSASYELSDSTPSHHEFCRPAFPGPHWSLRFLLGYPILFIIYLVYYLPVYIVLVFIVSTLDKPGSTDTFYTTIDWFLQPERLGLYLAVRAIRKCVCPFIRLFLVIMVKWTLIGKFSEGKRNRSQWTLFRHWMMAKMLPDGELCGVKELIGSHYEGISMIFRLLGAKVGKRVYWPGSGVPVVEYDLLEIGDDVVWGSRSIVMPTDRDDAKKIRIERGANVSDRCVLLPGVLVGEGVVLGSGTLGPKNHVFPPHSKWLGSKDGSPSLLETGKPPASGTPDKLTPFAKAVYLRQAPYFVIPWWSHCWINSLYLMAVAVFRSSRLVVSWVVTDVALGGEAKRHTVSYGTYVGSLLGIYMGINAGYYLGAILVDIGSKWLIIGRRKPGSYAWHESSYCQRWKLHLLIQNIRSTFPILHQLQGTPFLVWYFRALGCNIGSNVCLYPTGGDPMMTEPDLITIGDRVGIDDGIIVGHLNTQGTFSLNKVTIEQESCIRKLTRLNAGATLEEDALLLEHTLILPGDRADAGSVWQGWPANMQPGDMHPDKRRAKK